VSPFVALGSFVEVLVFVFVFVVLLLSDPPLLGMVSASAEPVPTASARPSAATAAPTCAFLGFGTFFLLRVLGFAITARLRVVERPTSCFLGAITV
jgi:hypothetical protein